MEKVVEVDEEATISLPMEEENRQFERELRQDINHL